MAMSRTARTKNSGKVNTAVAYVVFIGDWDYWTTYRYEDVALDAGCSVGPIIALMGLVIFSKGDLSYQLTESAYSIDASLGLNFLPTIIGVAKEVVIALGLIVIFFMLLNVIFHLILLKY